MGKLAIHGLTSTHIARIRVISQHEHLSDGNTGLTCKRAVVIFSSPPIAISDDIKHGSRDQANRFERRDDDRRRYHTF